MKWFLLALLALTASPLHRLASAGEITIYAATSLEAPLREYSARVEKETGHHLKFVFGRSDELVRSIKAGARGDVLFSASDELLDQAENAGKLIAGTRYALLSNFLVIAVPHGDIGNPPSATLDLAKADVKKIGLVKPDSAPVGLYAKAYLEKAHLWEQVKAKVVSFEKATALLEAVEKREVDAAILFKSDVLQSPKAQIGLQINRDQGPQISYALAALAGSSQPDLATLAVTYLSKPEAMEIFEKYGFTQQRVGSAP